MASVGDIKRVLRKYTNVANVEGSALTMERLGTKAHNWTSTQVARMVYLTCATTNGNRMRAALAAQRANTPTARAVEAIEELLKARNCSNVDSIKTARNTGAVTVVCDGMTRAAHNPLLMSGDGAMTDHFPGRMIKEVASIIQAKRETNAATPGYIDGKPVQVRGGATVDWTTHAEKYVLK